MPALNPVPASRPISDLRTRLADIETQARESGQPIVLTRNGAASLVVMDSDAYNAAIERTRHIQKLREAEIEAKYKKETLSLEDVKARMARVMDAVGDLDA